MATENETDRLEAGIAKAERYLAGHAGRALEDAESVSKSAFDLRRRTTRHWRASIEDDERQIAGLQARVTQLAQTIDADSDGAIFTNREGFREDLSRVEAAISPLVSAAPFEALVPGTREAIAHLDSQLRDLERTMFETIHRFEQQHIAQAISASLADAEFVVDGLAVEGDDAVRVVGHGRNAQGKDDGRLARFVITSKGSLMYDFAGYQGDACIPDIEAVFAYLRERGVIALPSGQIPANPTPEEITKLAQQPEFSVNKRQVQLQEVVTRVLQGMFSTVLVTASQGFTELEGFDGEIGHRYRVSITPGGSATVLRNGKAVTDEDSDTVVRQIAATVQPSGTRTSSSSRLTANRKQGQRQ